MAKAKYDDPRKFDADHLLFKENEMGEAAWLLVAGEVKLWRGAEKRPSFQHVFRGDAKRPQLIGKPALMGEAHEVSARSLSAVTVVPIPRAAFVGVLEKADPLLRMMMIALLHDVVLFQGQN